MTSRISSSTIWSEDSFPLPSVLPLCLECLVSLPLSFGKEGTSDEIKRKCITVIIPMMAFVFVTCGSIPFFEPTSRHRSWGTCHKYTMISELSVA